MGGANVICSDIAVFREILDGLPKKQQVKFFDGSAQHLDQVLGEKFKITVEEKLENRSYVVSKYGNFDAEMIREIFAKC